MPHFQTVTTIFHDGRFWVALIERIHGDTVEIARHVFGAEPSNTELLAWAGHGFGDLRFVPSSAPVLAERPANPKRRKREAAAALRVTGPGRAKEALKAATAMNAQDHLSDRSDLRRSDRARRYVDRSAGNKARKSGKA